MTDRYELLARLHEAIEQANNGPVRGYLEIGVQTGAALHLAKAKVAVGVDPDWGNLTYDVGNAVKVEATSDFFFEHGPGFDGIDGISQLDLAFIDGLHLAEQVWRDWLGVVDLAHDKTLIVFDDVLPRNQGEAAREMCPGDWTGDVWRAAEAISEIMGARAIWVDTFPTGMMIVLGRPTINQAELAAKSSDELQIGWTLEDDLVPTHIIGRDMAVQPDEALKRVATWLSL